jgi:isoquinoline 1-oxidoreductase beta subunit
MSSLTPFDVPSPDSPLDPPGHTRRRFLGYVLAGSTLAVAAQVGFSTAFPGEAKAASPLPSNPQPYDAYDLSDLIRDSCRPTNNLLTIAVERDGTAVFDMPRAEVGQGITTAMAMVIADELDLPVEKVRITLADARPELVFNQLTGGSTTMYSLYEPVRTAAALARQRLAGAAAARWGVPASTLTLRDGVVAGPHGQTATYGELTEAAASATTRVEEVTLKADAGRKVVGKARTRTDALAAVTGRKKFAMDLKVPDALPTMVCRPPTLKGTVKSVKNLDEVKGMPGVTHVAPISTGVAVRAVTFGQCIDAVRALRVDWGTGTVDTASNATVLDQLVAAEIPLTPAPPGAQVVEHTFTFNFRSGSPLETNCAVADVRPDSAEIWSSLKFPIIAKNRISELLGLAVDAVKVHVVEGGGSFGRHLFPDAALEAAEASKAFGKPVRLMWHRTDDSRHGRLHPMATSRVRASVVGDSVVAYEQRHSSVATDFTHGLGEAISSTLAQQGMRQYGNLGFSESIFELTTNVPYNFGATSQLLNEIMRYDDFPTSSVRNIYSPDTVTARELVVDELAKRMGQDAVEFRKAFLKGDARLRGVLEKVAEVGKWGRKMPAGTAQGIAIHNEYKSRVACLMEIDTRPATVNRRIRDAYTGPRITKVVFAVDVGLPINPRGIEAQMMGGAMDGIAQALTAGLHLENGLPLEGSWDDYRYTRQWNVPFDFECVVMPATTDHPGGAGELGCGVSQAAAACAYGRAVGKVPTEFPINFRKPLGFTVKTKTPPVPQSPTNGLRFAR